MLTSPPAFNHQIPHLTDKKPVSVICAIADANYYCELYVLAAERPLRQKAGKFPGRSSGFECGIPSANRYPDAFVTKKPAVLRRQASYF